MVAEGVVKIKEHHTRRWVEPVLEPSRSPLVRLFVKHRRHPSQTSDTGIDLTQIIGEIATATCARLLACLNEIDYQPARLDHESETCMTVEASLAATRSEFPLTQEWTYVNHATHGPYPLRSAEAIKAYADAWTNPATYDSSFNSRVVSENRAGIARLAGGSPENVAFVGSLADGMNLLGNGLEWKSGDNLILPAHEFPSVVYPFLNLQRLGVEIRFVQRNSEGRTDLGIIEQHMDDRTRAVAISHVEWQDGFRNDLKALGDLCESRGIELFVDATQSLGARPINLEETKVTAIAAHGYKWLLSSFGNAVVVFNKGAVDRIYPTYIGRLSVDADSEDTNWQLNFRPTAERYQTGGLNVQSLIGMHASLSLLNEVTPEASAEHTDRLTDQLATGLTDAGYTVVSDRSPEHRSQILTFTSGNREEDLRIVEHLSHHKISVAVRGGRIRVSPFFYNTPSEIDHLLEHLPPL